MKDISKRFLQPSDWPVVDWMLGVVDIPKTEIIRQQDRRSKFRRKSVPFDDCYNLSKSSTSCVEEHKPRLRSTQSCLVVKGTNYENKPICENPQRRDDDYLCGCMGFKKQKHNSISTWFRRNCRLNKCSLNRIENFENSHNNSISYLKTMIQDLYGENRFDGSKIPKHGTSTMSSLFLQLEKPLLKCGPDGSIICDDVDIDILIAGFMIYEKSFRQGALLPFANVLPRES